MLLQQLGAWWKDASPGEQLDPSQRDQILSRGWEAPLDMVSDQAKVGDITQGSSGHLEQSLGAAEFVTNTALTDPEGRALGREDTGH